MATCRPSKWVIPWALLGAGLPWLAAATIGSGSLKADISQRAAMALSGNESTAWAKADADGRDFLVSGTAPSQEAADAAVKAVAGTYGVRTAMASPQLKVEPPSPVAEAPAATTETPAATNEAPAAPAGAEAPAATAEAPAATAEAPAATAEAPASTAEAPAASSLPLLAPAEIPAGAKWPYTITGTWPEAPGAKLKATVGMRTYELGRGAALTSDGQGNFSFAPAAKLAPGTYDVEFTANDAAGAATTSKLVGAIVIPEPAPAASAAQEQPAAAAPAEAQTQQSAQAETAEPTATPAPVPTPTAMTAPTVEKKLDLSGSPIIRGTWPEGSATGLTVGLGTKTYTLGKDANLSSKAGVWSLIPSASLKDGIYDVVVTATDANGNSVKDETVAEIEVDAVPPDAPAVTAATAATGEGSPTTLAGTWAEKQSTGLKVSIPAAKIAAELGAPGSPLTSDGGGNWSLALPAPLPPGTYDVEVASTDQHGRVQTITSTGGLVVAESKSVAPAPEAAAPDAAAPAATTPAVPVLEVQQPPADAVWPYAITGKWAEGSAVNLKANLAGRTYELGKGAALTSDGKGTFTFAPRAANLAPGGYTVWFTSKDAAGGVEVASAAITIPETAAPPGAAEPAEPVDAAQPPQPVTPERVFNCETTLATLNQVFPVRFGFDKSNLEGIASLSLSQYAALLKDTRCSGLKVEIGGHADYYGPAVYNQGLSERRAVAVLDALKGAGVSESSLVTKGYGEKNPLDPAQTIAAREKNRRVEFTVVK